jgi:hypothetical protein
MNWRVGVMLLTLAALLLWWGWPSPSAVVAPVRPVPQPVATATAVTEASTAPPAGSAITVQEQLPEPVAASFALVAQSYAAELATPVYSRPLTAADSQLLNPNQFFAQSIPAAGGGSFRLEASQYRFSYPEPVVVSLIADGVQLSAVRVTLVAELTGRQLASQAVEAQEGKAGEGNRYSASVKAAADWDGPVRVQFSFDYRGDAQQLQTGIEYSQPVAEITGVGRSSARGADLVIPVKLRVKLAGHYRLRANLLTADHEPVAQLTARRALGKGPQQLLLRAHKTALAGRGGPYLLSTFVLERMSPQPAEPTRYGHSSQTEFEVEAIALDSLSDEAVAVSAEEQQRLELLQRLAVEK